MLIVLKQILISTAFYGVCNKYVLCTIVPKYSDIEFQCSMTNYIQEPLYTTKNGTHSKNAFLLRISYYLLKHNVRFNTSGIPVLCRSKGFGVRVSKNLLG